MSLVGLCVGAVALGRFGRLLVITRRAICGGSVSSFGSDRMALGLARIEAHYFAHDLFLPPGGLLAHMHRITAIPAEIIQGRYDMICPPCTAYDLAAAWPGARITMIPDAGHSALEPGTRCALLAAVERMRAIA